MSNDRNKLFIENYVLLKTNGDSTYLNEIVDEAMNKLNYRGYLYVNELVKIIEQYYPPIITIDGWHYHGIEIDFEDLK